MAQESRRLLSALDVVRRNPGDEHAWYTLSCLASFKDPVLGIALAWEAIDAAPSSLEAWGCLRQSANRSGNVRLECHAIIRQIRLNPCSHNWFMLAELMARRGKRQTGVAALRRAVLLERAPVNDYVWLIYADLAIEVGEVCLANGLAQYQGKT